MKEQIIKILERYAKDNIDDCITDVMFDDIADEILSLQLLQPDVIKSVCSDKNLQCTDYKTACEKCLNAFYEYKKQTVL